LISLFAVGYHTRRARTFGSPPGSAALSVDS
jgi:hypothetical protein